MVLQIFPYLAVLAMFIGFGVGIASGISAARARRAAAREEAAGRELSQP